MMQFMKIDAIKLYSSVKPPLLRKVLFKGTFLAAIGVITLAFTGAFMTKELLEFWGIPILVFSSLCLIYGMVPYRRLLRLETQPSELIVVDDKYLQMIELGKQMYSVPLSMIQEMHYFESGDEYGIALQFKEKFVDKIIVHNPRLNIQKQLQKSRSHFSCDLFIPYFTRRSFTRIAFLKQ